MYILLFIAIVCTVYVAVFKDNFTKEHIDKVLPFLILIVVVSLLLCILTSTLR